MGVLTAKRAKMGHAKGGEEDRGFRVGVLTAKRARMGHAKGGEEDRGFRIQGLRIRGNPSKRFIRRALDFGLDSLIEKSQTLVEVAQECDESHSLRDGKLYTLYKSC